MKQHQHYSQPHIFTANLLGFPHIESYLKLYYFITFPPQIECKLYEMKQLSQRDICTSLCIATLFKIAKTWEKLKCLSIYEWIKKRTYTIEYYSAIKKNKTLLFARTWMNLEGITLCETSERKANTVWSHSFVESKKPNS